MYPLSLIPKKEYKHKIEADCLVNSNYFFFIRRVDDNIENIYDSQIGYVRPSAFVSKLENGQKIIELPGLSVNLLCVHCDENSTDFKANATGMIEWDGITICPEAEVSNHYDPTPNHTNIYIPLAEIHNAKFDVVHIKQGDTIKKLNGKKYIETKDSAGKELVVESGGGSMHFEHAPTIINYWHFELNCIINGKLIKRKQNTTERSSLDLAIESIFSMTSSPDLPDPKNHDPIECYLIEENK